MSNEHIHDKNEDNALVPAKRADDDIDTMSKKYPGRINRLGAPSFGDSNSVDRDEFFKALMDNAEVRDNIEVLKNLSSLGM